MQPWQAHQSISKALHASAKAKVRRLLPAFSSRVTSLRDSKSIRMAANALLKSSFPAATAAQLEALETYLIGLAATLDAKSELGEAESLRLQMAMDRVSKFMVALSNTLKKASDTDSTIVQNIK